MILTGSVGRSLITDTRQLGISTVACEVKERIISFFHSSRLMNSKIDETMFLTRMLKRHCCIRQGYLATAVGNRIRWLNHIVN